MPTFIRKNPAELKGDIKANKEVSKRLVKANVSSGIIGTTKGDAEKFDSVVKMLEDVETSLEVYLDIINNIINDDNAGELISREREPQKLLKNILMLSRTTGKTTFTLNKLPLTDVQTIRDYSSSYEKYLEKINNLINYMNLANDEFVNYGTPTSFSNVESDFLNRIFQDMSKQLGVIINNLNLKVLAYDSGVAQPVVGLEGSGYRSDSPCRCFAYNLDEPLKNNPMYQTQKYIF